MFGAESASNGTTEAQGHKVSNPRIPARCLVRLVDRQVVPLVLLRTCTGHSKKSMVVALRDDSIHIRALILIESDTKLLVRLLMYMLPDVPRFSLVLYVQSTRQSVSFA